MLPALLCSALLWSGLCVGKDNWHAFPEFRKYGPQLLAEFLKFAYARGEPANVAVPPQKCNLRDGKLCKFRDLLIYGLCFIWQLLLCAK